MIRTVFTTLLIVAAGCAGGQEIVPRLPTDGTAHTEKPGGSKRANDPWAGRSDLITAPAVALPTQAQLPQTTRFTLSNGLSVVLAQRPETQLVEVQLAVKAGTRHAPRTRMGVAEMTAALLTAGTATRSAKALARDMDVIGARLSAVARFDATLVTCSASQASVNTCLTTVADVVRRPLLAPDAVKNRRDQMRAGIRQQLNEPGYLATAHFQNLLWGDDHARGQGISPITVDSTLRKHVVAFHRSWYRPNNAVLVIAGNFDPVALKTKIQSAFRLWYRAKLPTKTDKQPSEPKGIRARIIDAPVLGETHIRLGHFGISRLDSDFYAALVVNHILGFGRESKLGRLAKKEDALSRLTTGIDQNADRGAFLISAVSTTPAAAASIRMILQQVSQLQDRGPGADELQSAKAMLIGAHLQKLSTTSQLASSLVAAELHGLGDNYLRDFPAKIAAVDRAAAQAFAKQTLRTGKLALVMVGKAKELVGQLKPLGVATQTVRASEPIAGYERNYIPEDPKAAAASARQVLARALSAKGGLGRLRSIKSFAITETARGTVRDQNGEHKLDATITRTVKLPKTMRRDLVLNAGKVKSGYVIDGDSGWNYFEEQGKREAKVIPPAFAATLKAQLWRDPDFVLLRYLDAGTKAYSLSDRLVDDKVHAVVRLVNKNGQGVTLFFDKKRYLLRRLTYRFEGLSAIERYSDYKPYKGVQLAYRRQMINPGNFFDFRIKKVRFNPAIDPKTFVKP